MSEFEETKRIADKLLDEPNADPDDTLRMLSRQFLRATERDDMIADLLTNLAQILDVVKGEWAEEWSVWDQAQRDEITLFLIYYHAKKGATR